MKDRINTACVGEYPFNKVVIPDIAFDKLKPPDGLQPLKIKLRTLAGEIIEDDDIIASPDISGGGVAADKSGTAGDKDFHN